MGLGGVPAIGCSAQVRMWSSYMEDLHPSRAYSYETSYVPEVSRPSTLIQIYVLGDGESNEWVIR